MEISIKSKMWNGGYPMMEYEVIAEIKREKNCQWELECKSCNHGNGNCRILITKDEKGNYVYVGMTSENCDDEFEEKHYYFHKDNGNFYLTKEEAEIEKLKKYIFSYENEVKKYKEKIAFNENEIEKYKDMLKSYIELLNKLTKNYDKRRTKKQVGKNFETKSRIRA